MHPVRCTGSCAKGKRGIDMEFHQAVILKDGRPCLLRNGTEQDGQALLDIYLLTHEQTDYLLSYADESTKTVEEEARFLADMTASADGIELLAELDGIVVGSAGIGSLDRKSVV